MSDRLADMELPQLPLPLLEGLEATLKSPSKKAGNSDKASQLQDNSRPELHDGLPVATSTAAFLSGKFAETSGWNNRLFKAACDLHARGVPRQRAEQMLLQAAGPRSDCDERLAKDTIHSAFSEPRKPSCY